ncbi:MAG: demethoxyubiquinone hydroxylase family protein [Alphaproteobacteria bacterium]|nr:demethoxyubiquinone hydroxylase family protein [Alphaproteobacteria bacterium]
MSRRALERALRVDHAGEYGARRIYEGQLAVLEGRASEEVVAALRGMLAQEGEHLAAFEEILRARGVRPTALQPFWHAGGWLLGAATAALGEGAAFACTVAVEEVIEGHYRGQAAALREAGVDDEELLERLERFADEEAAHGEEAAGRGAETAPPGLEALVRGVTRLAIGLSERV